MQIWVDADACPGEIKEMLYRAAERAKVQVTLVANQVLRTPPLMNWTYRVAAPNGGAWDAKPTVELVPRENVNLRIRGT